MKLSIAFILVALISFIVGMGGGYFIRQSGCFNPAVTMHFLHN